MTFLPSTQWVPSLTRPAKNVLLVADNLVSIFVIFVSIFVIFVSIFVIFFSGPARKLVTAGS